MARQQARLIVREAAPGDGLLLWPHLREGDRLEILAAWGRHAGAWVLERGILDRGARTLAVEEKGTIIALFGVTQREDWPPPGKCGIWLVGSDAIRPNRKSLVRLAREWIPRLLGDAFGWNLVDSRHEESIRFLRHLGARLYVERAQTLADPGVPFWPFRLEACAPRSSSPP